MHSLASPLWVGTVGDVVVEDAGTGLPVVVGEVVDMVEFSDPLGPSGLVPLP